MRLAILGSTGQTGQALLRQSLDGGHVVSTITRRPVGITHPNLTASTGSIFDPADVRSCVANADAVLSVVGFGARPFRSATVATYARLADTLVETMRLTAVKRLLFCTSAGVVDDPGEIWFYRYLIKPLVLRKEYADMRAAESTIARSALDWTFVRPSRLTNGPLTGRYRVADGRRPDGGTSVSRADVAHYMLAEADRREWVRRTPTLAI